MYIACITYSRALARKESPALARPSFALPKV